MLIYDGASATGVVVALDCHQHPMAKDDEDVAVVLRAVRAVLYYARRGYQLISR